jgi:hypothetical protein
MKKLMMTVLGTAIGVFHGLGSLSQEPREYITHMEEL